MSQRTSIDALVAAHPGGAFVLDVREPAEYLSGHVPGAVNVPLAEVARRTHEVPVGFPVFVVCATGNRSQPATDVLRRAGVDAVSVDGGTLAWLQLGHPLVTGPDPGSHAPSDPRPTPVHPR